MKKRKEKREKTNEIWKKRKKENFALVKFVFIFYTKISYFLKISAWALAVSLASAFLEA